MTARPRIRLAGNPDFANARDVYLCERGPKDKAARSLFLMHSNCPMATVRRICLWCELLHVPIVQDPPGNLADGWKWPDDKPAPAPKLEPSF